MIEAVAVLNVQFTSRFYDIHSSVCYRPLPNTAILLQSDVILKLLLACKHSFFLVCFPGIVIYCAMSSDFRRELTKLWDRVQRRSRRRKRRRKARAHTSHTDGRTDSISFQNDSSSDSCKSMMKARRELISNLETPCRVVNCLIETNPPPLNLKKASNLTAFSPSVVNILKTNGAVKNGDSNNKRINGGEVRDENGEKNNETRINTDNDVIINDSVVGQSHKEAV